MLFLCNITQNQKHIRRSNIGRPCEAIQGRGFDDPDIFQWGHAARSFETSNTAPDVVIITGMSGASRTEAMHTFEDLGYFCIDNLPPSLIMNMISLASLPGQNEIGRKLAIVCDARNREYFKQLVGELANMEAAGVTFRMIFLDAADSILIARYKASRRRHPLCINNKRSIGQAI